jgi:ribosomal protein S12 methylthiotransferase
MGKGRNRLVNVITLGCSKNTVDSEYLARQLQLSNIKVVHDSNDPSARTVVINTCGFINDAKEESIDTILRYVDAKKRGKIDHVFVMGCLSERYKEDLRVEIPEVDQYFGVHNLKEALESLGVNYQESLLGERMLSTPPHYAYLKVSEGCDRTCAFCAIPLIRGPHVSRKMEDILDESRFLAREGVKELILVAQDLTYYGLDIYKEQRIAPLVEELSGIPGIEWIRLHYAFPNRFPADLIRLIRENPKVCNYLDIPFQHISDKMLALMRRGIDGKGTRDLIRDLRDGVPGIALRTSLVVGHPGETDEDFNELVEFVKTTRFERLGVFTYSHEEDTYAWKHYQDDVPEEVKQERQQQLMDIQRDISASINQTRVGSHIQIIIDRKEGEHYVGRTAWDSPEVDNEVLVDSGNQEIAPGTFIRVEITGADEFDLHAKIS